MRILCWRRHWLYSCGPGANVFGPRTHSLGDFLVCGIVRHPIAAAWGFLIGVLWAREEGDVIRWRWRFWQPSLHRTIPFKMLLKEG